MGYQKTWCATGMPRRRMESSSMSSTSRLALWSISMTWPINFILSSGILSQWLKADINLERTCLPEPFRMYWYGCRINCSSMSILLTHTHWNLRACAKHQLTQLLNGHRRQHLLYLGDSFSCRLLLLTLWLLLATCCLLQLFSLILSCVHLNVESRKIEYLVLLCQDVNSLKVLHWLRLI